MYYDLRTFSPSDNINTLVYMNAFLYDIILYDIIAIHSTVSFYVILLTLEHETDWVYILCFFFSFWENGYLLGIKAANMFTIKAFSFLYVVCDFSLYLYTTHHLSVSMVNM